MNVLGILQSFAYEMGIQPPSAYDSIPRYTYLLYGVARTLRNSRSFPQQKKTTTITLSSGRNKYPLPADFHAGLLGTQFDTNRRWQLIGPLSDAEWNYRLYGPGAVVTTLFAYRVFGPDMNQSTGGGQIQLNPTPASTITISLEYLSKNLFRPPDWTSGETGITVNKYRNANGLILKCTAITSGTCGTTPPSASGVDEGVTWTVVTAPYETILTDNDTCIFDEDIIIQGLKYFYLKSIREDFSAEKDLFDKMIDSARARWIGSHKGNLAGKRIIRRRYGPATLGGWPIS